MLLFKPAHPGKETFFGYHRQGIIKTLWCLKNFNQEKLIALGPRFRLRVGLLPLKLVVFWCTGKFFLEGLRFEDKARCTICYHAINLFLHDWGYVIQAGRDVIKNPTFWRLQNLTLLSLDTQSTIFLLLRLLNAEYFWLVLEESINVDVEYFFRFEWVKVRIPISYVNSVDSI